MIKRVTVDANRTNVHIYDGDKSISRAGVIDYQMRIGTVPISMGGIAGVGTDRGYRGKGYSRQVLEDCIALQTEQGCDLSVLFGIPEYYQKFGYASALADAQATVRLRYAEEAITKYEIRPMEVSDLPAIRDIYSHMTADATGTLVRSDSWKGFRKGADWRGRFQVDVLVDGRKIVGYAVYELDLWKCELAEAGYIGPEVFSTLLALMARDALEKRLHEITVHAAPSDPFLAYCRRYGCRLELDYPARGGGMARVVNQTGLLNKLQPLFTRRLCESGCAWAGKLTVETDLGTDNLLFGDGDELVLRVPQWILAQLVLGYRSVEDAAFETEAEIEQEAVPLLTVLFPEGFPFMWTTDHF